ncbi:hypothetical protein PT974_10532 [Cladobotryum mycophilum]|uniref:Short chain dehydrogenase n=1 Tax=Cladobotryum mycophilum TaxID=491253 RepID=A0ABR0SA41_9HYPO
MSKFYAIISGVGSGTGAATALRFSQSYTTILLARQPSNYEPVVAQITEAGGRAIGIATDLSDPKSVDAAFAQIEKELPDHQLAAVVFNAHSGWARKPFLELGLEDLRVSLATSTPSPNSSPPSPQPPTPSLIVTGATASLRGSAYFSTFAAGKFAQRAITQSLAREFGPKGVHVALAVIDGGIDTPWQKDRVVNDGVEDGKLKPEAIADSYWHLHTQHRSSFTQELDLRPYVEKF